MTSAGIIMSVLLLTIAGCFFQYAESAVISVSSGRLKEREENGEKQAQAVSVLRSSAKSHFYITVRLILLLCSFGLLMLGLRYLRPEFFALWNRIESLSDKMADGLAVACTLLLTASFIIVNCRLIPRKIGIHRCETDAFALARLMVVVTRLCYPASLILLEISHLIVKLFGVPAHADEKLATEDEILMMVDASGEKGVIEESEADMIANIFEFGDTTASEAMTHRTDVEALEYTSDVRQAVQFALDNGFSRIPVYKDDLDNIQGVLYVKDLLRFVGQPDQCDTPIYKLMRPACYIPETKKLRELFGEMTETKVQMAVVVDEYGGTSGIITMEDLIESILGNIQDEFDNEDEEISRVNDHAFTIDGTTSIYEVSDLLDTDIPEGDYDTLAGYIVSTLGRIPTEDEHPSIRLGDYEFKVEQVTDRRISRVHVVNLSVQDPAASDTAVLKDSQAG